MKKGLKWLLILMMLLGSVSLAVNEVNVNVLVLSGNTGLAMVKMMEQPVNKGVHYQFQVFKSPDQLLGKIITGQADIAALPTNSAAILYNKGAEIQLTSIIGWGVMYLVSNDRSVKKWSDLKGKEVYIPVKGAVPDLLFQYISIKNGLNPATDLKITYISSPAELAQLTVAGKVQLALLPEPWVTEALEQSSRLKVTLDIQKEWGKVEKTGPVYPQSCILVRKQFAREHPEIIKAFSRGLESSIGWLKYHPSQGAALAEKYVQLSAVSVQKGLKRCNLKYSDAYAVRPQIRNFLEKLYSVAPQAVGGKLPDEGFYYRP